MEYLDIVNEKDEVVGKEDRKSTDYQKNRHRIVHIFLYNDRGEFALQLRSRSVGYLPGTWCATACGHVSAGEDYDTAAHREMMEELGVDTEIKFIAKDVYDHGYKAMLVSYKGFWNGDFKPDVSEVDRVEFFSLFKIQEMIDQGIQFHDQSLFLLEKHFLK